MRLLKYALSLLALLLLVPAALAQENTGTITIELEEDSSFEELFNEYGCPVGIRDANQSLVLNTAGRIAAGQSVIIPLDSPLCGLDYSGEILFVNVRDYSNESTRNSYYAPHIPLSEFAAAHNVCEATLRDFNPEWLIYWESIDYPEWFFYNESNAPIPNGIRVPVDSPACFESHTLASGEHPRDLATSLNICEEEIWYFNPESIYHELYTERTVYVPLDYSPCFVDGQLREYIGYPNLWGDYIPVSTVTLEKSTSIYEFAISNGYCDVDLRGANHRESFDLLRAGDTVYIPEGIEACAFEGEVGKSMVQVSREYNVCIEALINVNGWWLSSWAVIIDDTVEVTQFDEVVYHGVFVPLGNPPCYDENGLRIGQNDRAVHEASQDEWPFAIAQQYEVCLADLFAANSMMNSHPEYKLPALVFIPNTAPCSDVEADGFVHYQVQAEDGSETSSIIQELSYLYNICPSAIVEANPSLIDAERAGYHQGWYILSDIAHEITSYWLNDVEAGATILIPAHQPPCYDYSVTMIGIGHYRQMSAEVPAQNAYVCYEQEVDPYQDYTGHEPAISPIPYHEGAHCYDRLSQPRVVINNVTYTLYPWIGDAYPAELAECFGANLYEIIVIDAEKLGMNEGDFYLDSYWGIPNATQDCPLVGTDREAALDWKRNFYQSSVFGTLNQEGEYVVNYGDTLYDIGKRYGYLPEWIMAENAMTDDWVYPYQRLRLPNYPNLYQMATYGGAAAGALALFLGASFALRLRGKARKGKKKNDE